MRNHIQTRQRICSDANGSVTVELAFVLGTFLLLMLGTLETARVLYLFNTVQDVTRVVARAASITDFSKGEALVAIRKQALFDAANGSLPLVPELGTAQVRIEYLAQNADGTTAPITNMPRCPAQNVANCTRQPFGGSCIRLVRASICGAIAANGACTPLRYRPMTGYVPGFASLTVPPSATLVKAESLGFVSSEPNCL
jgi:TadE-like protein